MNCEKKRVDVTSADTRQLGFEYQYLYFFLQLFSLKRGDEVGYETLDDVHKISAKDGITYLYQLKHTNQTDASGNPMNLTELSLELWKTFSNWSELITDPHDGRKNVRDQKNFLKDKKFVFVSNRTTRENSVYKKIEEYKKETCDYDGIMKYLVGLTKKTSNDCLVEYINNVVSLNKSVLDLFVRRIEIVNTFDDLLDEIRDEIRNMMISEEYIDDVLAKIYLKLKEDFFEKCKKGMHQIIRHEIWIKEYGIFFNEVRTTMLPLRTYEPQLPEHLEQQIFVKELIEIGVVEQSDMTEMADLTYQYLCLKLQLEDWREEGRLTKNDLLKFHEEATTLWHRLHVKNHRTTKANPSLDWVNAVHCYDEIMVQKLQLLQTDMGIELSNGEFINLSNEERIGWKYFWKDVYRNNGK